MSGVNIEASQKISKVKKLETSNSVNVKELLTTLHRLLRLNWPANIGIVLMKTDTLSSGQTSLVSITFKFVCGEYRVVLRIQSVGRVSCKLSLEFRRFTSETTVCLESYDSLLHTICAPLYFLQQDNWTPTSTIVLHETGSRNTRLTSQYSIGPSFRQIYIPFSMYGIFCKPH